MFITFNAKIAQALSSMWFHSRILELVFTACDLIPFAQRISAIMVLHLDGTRTVAFFCVVSWMLLTSIYTASKRDDVDYIMDTFPIVRRKDEAAYGEYRTKRVILEIYDEMAEAMRTGQPYQTRLDPPPGDPRAAHPWDEEYLGPYKPPEEWWQEVRDGRDRGRGGMRHGQDVQSTSTIDSAVSPQPNTRQNHQGTRSGFRAKPPPARQEEKTAKPPRLPDQPSLISDFSPPQGSRSQRLKRVMALGQPKNSANWANCRRPGR